VLCSGVVRNSHGDLLVGPGMLSLTGVDSGSWLSTRIDDSGRFAAAVTAGKYTANVRTGSLSPTGIDVGTIEITAERNTNELVVPGARITGRALDLVTGAPLTGSVRHVWVALAPDGGEDLATLRRALTDDAGEFVFDAVGPGAWTAVVDSGMTDSRDVARFEVREADTFLSVDLRVRLE
jgi:hypothetical protein